MSSSFDKSIIFYNKDKYKYQLDYKIIANGSCSSITQTKTNEICYSEYVKNAYNICFYNLIEKQIKSSITKMNCFYDSCRTFNMITKDLLAFGGENKITIINVNQYSIIREIKILKTSINGFCMLN